MRHLLNLLTSGFLLLVVAGVASAQDAQTFFDSGNASFNKGDFDRAISDYTEVIRLNPNAAVAYSNRGTAWRHKGELDIAIRDYTEAIRLDPKYAHAYYIRGNALSNRRDFDNAIRDYTEVIRLDPKNANAYSNRGVAWSKKGELDRAISDYNESIRLDPKNADSYNSLAWLMATSPEEEYRDGERAVKYAKKACDLTENKDVASMDTLAVAYAEAGDFDRAVQTEELALTLPPVVRGMTAESVTAELGAHLELFKAGKAYREERKE